MGSENGSGLRVPLSFGMLTSIKTSIKIQIKYTTAVWKGKGALAMDFRLVPKVLLLLLLLFLTLPLHLLSACFRLLHGSRGGWVRRSPSALFLLSLPIVFLAFSGKAPPPLAEKHGFSYEFGELKLKLAKLESTLEDNTNMLNNKVKQLKENDLLIEEMELNIQYLQNSLNGIKKSAGCSSPSGKRISDMEEEVRHLWAESRKNNFDLHTLELQTHDAEKNLKDLTSQFLKVESIVAEQWIQIRQAEQALQLTKMRASKATKGKESTKCTFLESARNWCKYQLLKEIDFVCSCFSKENISIVSSYFSRVFHYFKKILSIIQEYHHKLQYYVKQTLESCESTANLANKELVFFLASAVIVFPITVAVLLVTV